MSLSRQLIAFAYVADAFQKTGDITLGLLPLFAPVIASRAGTEFVPEQFARDVDEQLLTELQVKHNLIISWVDIPFHWRRLKC